MDLLGWMLVGFTLGVAGMALSFRAAGERGMAAFTACLVVAVLIAWLWPSLGAAR